MFTKHVSLYFCHMQLSVHHQLPRCVALYVQYAYFYRIRKHIQTESMVQVSETPTSEKVKKKWKFSNCLWASVLLAEGEQTALSSRLHWSTEEVERESCSSLAVYLTRHLDRYCTLPVCWSHTGYSARHSVEVELKFKSAYYCCPHQLNKWDDLCRVYGEIH